MSDQEIIKRLKEGKTIMQLVTLNKVDAKRARKLRDENNIPKKERGWFGNLLK